MPSVPYPDRVPTELTVAEVSTWCALEGVPSALAAARDAVDVRLRDRGLRRTSPELTAESLLRGAAASATLDGSESTPADLRDGTADATATAAAEVNAGLLALVAVVRRAPLQAIARLHTLAASGSTDPDRLGRPRTDADVARRLQTLAVLLLTTTTEVPAIAVAGVAHAEIASLEPFASRNGLVARALERLLLVARGVDPASMLVPEAGHLRLESSYRKAIAAYAGGGLEGRRAWLLHVAEAVTRGVEESPLPPS